MARHLAIGDIHGCINALTTLAEFVGFRDDDTIVTLGDYVDRGPDTRAVIEFMIELGKTHSHVPLRGNHEIMMLDSRESMSWRESWLRYGGQETLQSYALSEDQAGSFSDIPDSHYDFLENKLVPYYECESHFFVHANATTDVALENQGAPALYWQKYKDPKPHCSGKIMVCGHTVQPSGEPFSNGNSVCIDTWAYGDGWLSCLDVESGTVWQANEDRETRTLTIERNW
jgi:serine/threonine protein phosphatase 1